MAKTQLHQILAVESDRKNVVNKVIAEGKNTFNKKPGLFNGIFRSYQPIDEKDVERFSDETKPVEYTVRDKFQYVMKHVASYVDLAYQKDMANTMAKADIIVDDDVLASNVPAVMLITLEKQLIALRGVFEAAPTLGLGYEWKVDDKAKNTWKATGKPVYKSKKKTTAVVLYPATKEHPAQVKEVVEDIRVGQWNEIFRSGALSSAEKSEFLEKIDKLIGSIKKARSRANNQEVSKDRIANKIFNYILK